MGGRKNKNGGSSAHNSRRPVNNNGSNSNSVAALSGSSLHTSSTTSEDTTTTATMISCKEAWYMEKSLPYLSGWDLCGILAGIGLALFISLFLGFLSSVSLNIHYNLRETAGVSAVLRGQLGALPPLVLLSATSAGKPLPSTRVDPTLASHHHKQWGRYFVHTAENRQQSVLAIVERSLPLDAPPSVYQDVWRTGTTATTKAEQPQMDFFQWTQYHPGLCPDGRTVGYDSWALLRSAVQEANTFSAERFVRWTSYFTLAESSASAWARDNNLDDNDDDDFYDHFHIQDETILLTICPDITLRARDGPIFINAGNLRIECDNCRIQVGGSHFSFGPYARNVLIRGMEFSRAETSSLVFYHDSAEVFLEDCRWIDNAAVHSKMGSVADVNSTSLVHFHRCYVGKRSESQSGFVSALSIRDLRK